MSFVSGVHFIYVSELLQQIENELEFGESIFLFVDSALILTNYIW